MVETPDIIVEHNLQGTCSCGKCFSEAKRRTERRQVVDIRFVREVTEHQVEIAECECGEQWEAHCPYSAPVQYGESVHAALYQQPGGTGYQNGQIATENFRRVPNLTGRPEYVYGQGFISTCRKQGLHIFQALSDIMPGKPVDLAYT